MSKRHRQLGLWEPDKASFLVKLFSSNKGEKTKKAIKQQLELHLICNNY